MYRFLLVACAVALLVGCKTPPKPEGDIEVPTGPGTEDIGVLPPPVDVNTWYPIENEPDPAVRAAALAALRDIHFAYDSDRILPNDAAVLEGVAAFLKQYDRLLMIEGHCDERGAEEYNMALGSRRASAARQFLIERGIDGNRLHMISYGELQTVNGGHEENSWAENRRDHFLLGKAK